MEKLKYYLTIRNAIAHKSRSAREKFQKMLENQPFLPKEKTPTGYLRSKPNGEQTQYEIATFELRKITDILCK